MSHAIFWPVIAQVALTAVVWCLMYVRRIGEIHRRRIDTQTLATADAASEVLENVSAADNFRNLLETPVLFYAVCACLAITEQVLDVQVVLAWAYVGLRALHSLIHVTYNRVIHRFLAYVASTLCVFAMWTIFAGSLYLHG